MQTIKFLTAGLAAALLAQAATAGELREWTSKDGTQTMRGVLISQTTDTITIQEAAGQRRTIRKEFLTQEDLDFLKRDQGQGFGMGTDATAPGGAGARGKLAELLEGKLVDARGKDAGLDPKANPEFYLFYYSASWCPPCRAFTPELVKFHGRHRTRGNLQVILYPADRSEEESIDYLRKYRMPWPAIKLAEVNTPGIPRSSSPGIPAMVLTDKDGNILLSSGEGMSRDEFLKQTTQLLAGGR